MTDPLIEKIKTLGFIIKNKEQLPYGNKSRGRLVESEKGRRAILVPSWGALEKEEVDYYVEKAQDDEDARLKKNEITPMKENIGKLTTAAKLAKPGKRAEVIKEIIEENQRR